MLGLVLLLETLLVSVGVLLLACLMQQRRDKMLEERIEVIEETVITNNSENEIALIVA